ncbi:hypothetical protein N9Y79_00865 [Alphaproteobacteria bacterium]|nr:hypothetical protein [Alphaproteobacteria bacterium]
MASGFIITYGREIDENITVEIAHARYADSSSDGTSFLDTELTAFEISGIFQFDGGAPFVRLGYSDGELKAPVIRLDTLEIIGSLEESQSGPLFGVGFDIPINASKSAIWLEYNIADYDDAELSRRTIGALVKF